MLETNPYRPPDAELRPRRTLGRYRPLLTISRVLVGLWGLFILAGPTRIGPTPAYHHGQILAKALGATLFLVAVFPIRRPRSRSAVEPAEDL